MRLSSTQARKMLFAAIPSIHNLIFGLIVFYILGYNNLMFATIYQNSKFILELRINRMRSPSEKGPDPANQVKIKKKEENKGE